MLRRRGKAIGLVVATALVSGVAFASAEAIRTNAAAGTLIQGCYNKSNGALRVAKSCKRTEIKISWNSQGPQGPAGPSGAPGQQGASGPTGAAGPAGATGAKGDKGDQGLQGIQGAKGDKGDAGAQGVAGPAGLNWRGDWSPLATYLIRDAVQQGGSSYVATTAGPPQAPPSSGWQLLAQVGAPGAAGQTGPAGPAGPAGPGGQAGPAGPAGPTGATGPAGATGPQGPQGPAGTGGGTFSGTFTSPNGLYRLEVTNDGIRLRGPGGWIHLGPYAIRQG